MYLFITGNIKCSVSASNRSPLHAMFLTTHTHVVYVFFCFVF